MHPWGRPVVRQTQAHEFKMGSCLVAVQPLSILPFSVCPGEGGRSLGEAAVLWGAGFSHEHFRPVQGLSCFGTYFSFILNRPMLKYGIASPLKIDFG